MRRVAKDKILEKKISIKEMSKLKVVVQMLWCACRPSLPKAAAGDCVSLDVHDFKEEKEEEGMRQEEGREEQCRLGH